MAEVILDEMNKKKLTDNGQVDFSYNFEDTKVSLKISTAIKFDKFLKGEKTFFTNSVHSNSYISIMGYGNKGTNIPICMLTPEISNEYSSKEQIRHFKFVDVLCYKVKDEYFAGLYLDFIAKGVVDHDLFSGELSELQDRALKIFKFFYQHGKVPVIYLFANNIYFGKKYKKNLNLRLENLMDTT
ncbi:MAG: hypothetical protein NTX80_00070, partial [Candidatus Saccharibacteria bacterium]|nr:hypothetical protein [Candidatus Saccharibacteria bacterium]